MYEPSLRAVWITGLRMIGRIAAFKSFKSFLFTRKTTLLKLIRRIWDLASRMEFNSLPLEIHLEIFSYLPVRDVLSIRRVCKLWNGLINGELKFKRLRCIQFYIPNQRINCHAYDFVFASIRSFLDYTSTDTKFSRVNHLSASLAPKAPKLQDAFDFLNSFQSLKQVSFSCFLYDRLIAAEGAQKQFVVSLPRLEKATFYFNHPTRGSNVSLLLDLPSLRCLSIDSSAPIIIGHPEKLRTLATRSLFGAERDYSLFTNLTNIYTRAADVRSISAGFLEKLPSLSELHCAFGHLPADYRPPEPSLRKARPKIFYFGFEISSREIESEGAQWPSSFPTHDPTGHSTRFIARNLYRSIDSNSRVSSIDYNLIAGELNDTELFDVMFQKFPGIRHLRISGTVADQNRLLKLIDKFKVSSVAFESTSLPQRFFEQLAENRPFISSLSLNEPTMSMLSGDLDFVFNFETLRSLQFTNYPLSLNFVVRALKELKSISSLIVGQPETYYFSWLAPSSFSQNFVTVYCDVYVPRFSYSGCRIPVDEASDWMNALQSQLNDAVSPKELQILLSQLKYEKENALFWMRKYVYDQRHSICLSKEQISLLNLRHWAFQSIVASIVISSTPVTHTLRTLWSCLINLPFNFIHLHADGLATPFFVWEILSIEVCFLVNFSWTSDGIAIRMSFRHF